MIRLLIFLYQNWQTSFSSSYLPLRLSILSRQLAFVTNREQMFRVAILLFPSWKLFLSSTDNEQSCNKIVHITNTMRNIKAKVTIWQKTPIRDRGSRTLSTQKLYAQHTDTTHTHTPKHEVIHGSADLLNHDRLFFAARCRRKLSPSPSLYVSPSLSFKLILL